MAAAVANDELPAPPSSGAEKPDPVLGEAAVRTETGRAEEARGASATERGAETRGSGSAVLGRGVAGGGAGRGAEPAGVGLGAGLVVRGAGGGSAGGPVDGAPPGTEGPDGGACAVGAAAGPPADPDEPGGGEDATDPSSTVAPPSVGSDGASVAVPRVTPVSVPDPASVGGSPWWGRAGGEGLARVGGWRGCRGHHRQRRDAGGVHGHPGAGLGDGLDQLGAVDPQQGPGDLEHGRRGPHEQQLALGGRDDGLLQHLAAGRGQEDGGQAQVDLAPQARLGPDRHLRQDGLLGEPATDASGHGGADGRHAALQHRGGVRGQARGAGGAGLGGRERAEAQAGQRSGAEDAERGEREGRPPGRPLDARVAPARRHRHPHGSMVGHGRVTNK